jgi:hypothetical protein
MFCSRCRRNLLILIDSPMYTLYCFFPIFPHIALYTLFFSIKNTKECKSHMNTTTLFNMFNTTSMLENGSITKLYIEFTIALSLGLGTILVLYKVLPFITSAIIFFLKFCICAVICFFTLHLLRNSDLFRLFSSLGFLPF